MMGVTNVQFINTWLMCWRVMVVILYVCLSVTKLAATYLVWESKVWCYKFLWRSKRWFVWISPVLASCWFKLLNFCPASGRWLCIYCVSCAMYHMYVLLCNRWCWSFLIQLTGKLLMAIVASFQSKGICIAGALCLLVVTLWFSG